MVRPAVEDPLAAREASCTARGGNDGNDDGNDGNDGDDGDVGDVGDDEGRDAFNRRSSERRGVGTDRRGLAVAGSLVTGTRATPSSFRVWQPIGESDVDAAAAVTLADGEHAEHVLGNRVGDDAGGVR